MAHTLAGITRPLRRRLAATVATVLLAATGVAATASPASAATELLPDSFENNPAAVWSFGGAGSHHGGFGHDFGSPRTGQNLVWLNVWNAGWSSVGRPVRLPGTSRSCVAQFYLLSVSNSPINVEVIDPPTSRYVALRRVHANSSWQPYAVSWSNGPADVFIRASVLGAAGQGENRVMVDDFSVRCTY